MGDNAGPGGEPLERTASAEEAPAPKLPARPGSRRYPAPTDEGVEAPPPLPRRRAVPEASVAQAEQEPPPADVEDEEEYDTQPLVDKLLSRCACFRVLIVGNTTGKADLIKRVFGVTSVKINRQDQGIEDAIYSPQNERFCVHVASITGREDVEAIEWFIRSRKQEENVADHVHCIWYMADATTFNTADASELFARIGPLEVPIITLLRGFDRVYEMAEPVGRSRRGNGDPAGQSDELVAQGMHVLDIMNSLRILKDNAYTTPVYQVDETDTELVNTTHEALSLRDDNVRFVFVVAQHVSPDLKFAECLRVGMSQFLLGTAGASTPIPVPAIGAITGLTASRMIRADIAAVWNLYDPEGITDSTMQTWSTTLWNVTTGLPLTILYTIVPPIGLVKGFWEGPRAARTLSICIADMTLMLERLWQLQHGPNPEEVTMERCQFIFQRYLKAVRPQVKEELEAYFTTEGFWRSFRRDQAQTAATMIIRKYRPKGYKS